MNQIQKFTIAQTKEKLQEFFKAEEILYQPEVGYFIRTFEKVIMMKELDAISNELNLKVGIIGMTNDYKALRIFMEISE
jgi:hypothetical protein